MIYGVYSWDVIEPITYITGVFYTCVSMGFYLRYKDDFEWGNAFSVFQARKLRKLIKQQNIDLKRLEFLKTYKKDLEEGLAYLKK